MKLKFGKYKGLDLEDIMNESEGQQYLEWLRDNTETTGKYAKQNKQLISEIEEVIGKGPTQAAPRAVQGVARPQPAAQAAPSASAEILKQIAATLKSIEKIVANPKQMHIAESELVPDQDIPF